jgi:hypothetical protein
MATTLKNLDLWDSLSVTDPKYTKNFDRRGFKGTAISPAYVARRLTEAFGPCGVGWRFVLEDERYVEGHTLSSGDKSVIHVVRGHLDYKLSGETDWRSTGPQFGHTEFVGQNKNGVFTDDEAQKKSISDAQGKLAVLLGVSADIHLGLFDSSKYVNDPATGTSRAQSGKRGAAAGGAKKPAPRSARNSATAKGTTAPYSPSAKDHFQLPKGIENWLPEQYGEYFQDTESAEEFIDVFRFVRTLEWFIDEPETCRMICEIVSDTARQVLTRGSAEWNQVVDGLKEESARLTSLASE